MSKNFLLALSAWAVIGLLSPGASSAFDLPDDLPPRQAGLWESVQTGSPGKHIGTIEIRKEMCIDAKTDPLFHRLDVQELEASIVNLGGSCDVPTLAYADGTLSGGMSCISASPPDAKRTFVWNVSFENAQEVHVEERSLTDGAATDIDFRLTTIMRRIGDCAEGGRRPGGIRRVSDQRNGEETLKGMGETTVWNELAANEKLIRKMRELHQRAPD